ncbi:bifunctional glycosyltransferase/CDP-glycerol:glycerophosphate glycerophosphotransferase [Streptomyces sp. enrichment culture]|uniref:bifunctional glycosyltransferase/CDP-glycerol:glycerophosphate glycerophosphotransferase n=1 Tax=Streptomyces sp. enrichment culture TaxID=1795815 RepID=UPI003F56AB68
MPRFSVIVPAYQVQAYLHACLESVLSQSYADLELIAVDDCSPDACGEIVEEFAARDPRVRAVRLPERRGPGGARNAGLERARGDYLVFLDGGDTLTPHALRAVADRLKETGDPDVLVHGHARVDRTGERLPAGPAGQLTERGPAPFRLEDRPGLLRVGTAAWDKVCRREFVEREALTFPPGRHADLPWTYPLLLAADSLTTLDRVCVLHRVTGDTDDSPGQGEGPVDAFGKSGFERSGAGAGQGGTEAAGLGQGAGQGGAEVAGLGHGAGQGGAEVAGLGQGAGDFDVFAQYDRVFAFLDERPGLAQWRPVLFRRSIDHLATEFTRPGRLPRAARAEFWRRARAHHLRHRTPGAAAGPRARLRHTLVRLGLHRTHRALLLTRRPARRAARLAARLGRALTAAGLRLHYAVQRRLPLRADRAVFAAHGGRGHGCNPGALEEAMRELAPHIRTAWIAHPEHHHTIPPGTRRLTPGSAAYWTALARAKYLVTNDDFQPRPVKRRGQVLVQTRSGTPLKHMGLDLRERPAAARDTDVTELLRTVDTWDYVLSANRHATLTWERVYPGRYTTLEYGQPRNDVFLRATPADVTRLRESLGIPEGSVAILYAPTHRDYRRSQARFLDLDRVLRRLGPRFVVLARAHHLQPGPLGEGSRVIDVGAHPSVEKLCLASDALVTDYSSLMFDYACLDRPIVLHLPDHEAYEAARGTYVDLRSFPPGAVARGEDELIDIFATGHWRGSRSAQLRAAFRERFCPYDDGRAAERVVRHVVLGEPDTPPALPPQDRRPVPSAAAASDCSPLASVPHPSGPWAVTESR